MLVALGGNAMAQQRQCGCHCWKGIHLVAPLRAGRPSCRLVCFHSSAHRDGHNLWILVAHYS